MEDSGLLARWRSWAPYLLSIVRIIAAFLFMQVGTGVLEVFGGLLVLVGLFTRPAAFILSGEMAVAYFIGHAPQGLWPVLNQGSPAILFCFLFLYISAAGPGPWSLDALLSRRSP
jgi:putative oxidoreductase